MKVYVLGSNAFMKEMVESKNKLCELGHEGSIHPIYEAYMRGERQDNLSRLANGEAVAVKRDNDFFKDHYRRILESEAVLFVNLEKKGIAGYIGGNCLIEMGQAYVNDKKIFLLTELPKDLPYMDEIEAMDPICLSGDLSKIS